MTARLQAVAVLTLLLIAALAYPDQPADPLDDIHAPTSTYATADTLAAGMLPALSLTPRHPMRDDARRLSLASTAADVARARLVPPSLLLAVSYRESSWRSDGPPGPAGEVGLMQVHPSTVTTLRCRDMDTARGQLDCGAKRLRRDADRCGSWRGALHAYASRSGSCRASNRRVDWIGRDRMAMARRLREKPAGTGRTVRQRLARPPGS